MIISGVLQKASFGYLVLAMSTGMETRVVTRPLIMLAAK